MILMALVCTALTKPLVLFVDRFFSDNIDAYSFGDLHHNISPITTTLRRASRMVYGTDMQEWTLPASDLAVVLEMSQNNSKSVCEANDLADVAAFVSASADAGAAASTSLAQQQVTTAPPHDLSAASRIAWFWSRLAFASIASTKEARPGVDAAPYEDGTSPSSPSSNGIGRRSSQFREISKVMNCRGVYDFVDVGCSFSTKTIFAASFSHHNCHCPHRAYNSMREYTMCSSITGTLLALRRLTRRLQRYILLFFKTLACS
jgi:hypothetical protein